MDRRGFFAAVGAVGGALALGSEAGVRRVMFASPSEPPAIYWIHGHATPEQFAGFYSRVMDTAIAPSQVKHGWATRKMDRFAIYLSDVPRENFEPITYFIPADQERETTQ